MSFKNMGRQARESSTIEKNITKALGSNESSPGNVLTKIFWQMFTENWTLNNKSNKWHSLMDAWVTDQTGKVGGSSNSRSTARGNAAKEFFKDRFSWNVFIKSMQFLRKKRLRITIEAYDEKENVSTVAVEMDLRHFGIDGDEDIQTNRAVSWLSVLDAKTDPTIIQEEIRKSEANSALDAPKVADPQSLLNKIKKGNNE